MTDPATGLPIPAYNDPWCWAPDDEIDTDPDPNSQYVNKARNLSGGQNSHCLQASEVPVDSSVVPLSGRTSFQVPIGSGGSRGAAASLALTFNSTPEVDAGKVIAPIPHPAWVSDSYAGGPGLYCPRWTHTFAQWIEVISDGRALWHRGDGTTMAFNQYYNGQTGPLWKSDESYHTLTSTGSSNSPSFQCGDGSTFEHVPFGQFVLKDGDQTTYTFALVRWNVHGDTAPAACYAVPFYLLTRIQDRWGRFLQIGWGDFGPSSVSDADRVLVRLLARWPALPHP